MFSALHTGCLHFVQIDLLPRLLFFNLSQFVLSRTRGFCTVHQLKYFWSTTQINQIKKTDIYPVSISFFSHLFELNIQPLRELSFLKMETKKAKTFIIITRRKFLERDSKLCLGKT